MDFDACGCEVCQLISYLPWDCNDYSHASDCYSATTFKNRNPFILVHLSEYLLAS